MLSYPNHQNTPLLMFFGEKIKICWSFTIFAAPHFYRSRSAWSWVYVVCGSGSFAMVTVDQVIRWLAQLRKVLAAVCWFSDRGDLHLTSTRINTACLNFHLSSFAHAHPRSGAFKVGLFQKKNKKINNKKIHIYIYIHTKNIFSWNWILWGFI